MRVKPITKDLLEDTTLLGCSDYRYQDSEYGMLAMSQSVRIVPHLILPSEITLVGPRGFMIPGYYGDVTEFGVVQELGGQEDYTYQADLVTGDLIEAEGTRWLQVKDHAVSSTAVLIIQSEPGYGPKSPGLGSPFAKKFGATRFDRLWYDLDSPVDHGVTIDCWYLDTKNANTKHLLRLAAKRERSTIKEGERLYREFLKDLPRYRQIFEDQIEPVVDELDGYIQYFKEYCLIDMPYVEQHKFYYDDIGLGSVRNMLSSVEYIREIRRANGLPDEVGEDECDGDCESCPQYGIECRGDVDDDDGHDYGDYGDDDDDDFDDYDNGFQKI